MPVPRDTFALSCKLPLCPVHEAPAVDGGVGGGELAAVTVIPKAERASVDVPSLTLISKFAS
jgi:hypothetical protein